MPSSGAWQLSTHGPCLNHRQDVRRVRAPTGVSRAMAARADAGLDEVRGEVERVSDRLGRRIKLLVGKPGLDGHSNGAEQIAVRARDCGMEVVYEGIRLTPAQIVRAASDEAVHVVGLSILSGSHMPLVAKWCSACAMTVWTTCLWWWAASSRQRMPPS